MKNHVAGVSVFPLPDRKPVPETARKVLVWTATIDEVKVKLKLSGPAIDHSGAIGVEGSNTQAEELKATDCPLGMVMNEPLAEFALARLQVFTPIADEKLVVAIPDESWRTMPPPGPEEKLMVPMMDVACADVIRASEVIAATRENGSFMGRSKAEIWDRSVLGMLRVGEDGGFRWGSSKGDFERGFRRGEFERGISNAECFSWGMEFASRLIWVG